jgi:hypothetical protein
MRALVEDGGVTWRDALDLGRGCAGEWVRAAMSGRRGVSIAKLIVWCLGAVASYEVTAFLATSVTWTPPAILQYLQSFVGWAMLLRLWLLTPLTPSVSRTLRLANSGRERRALDVFLRLTSGSALYGIPRLAVAERWLLTVGGLATTLLDRITPASHTPSVGLGVVVCGTLAVVWVFGRGAQAVVPERVA